MANQKGGVGKTTTAVNIAAELARHGATVVLIDLDPQGNASTALGLSRDAGGQGSYDVLVDGLTIREVAVQVQRVPGLWAITSSADLAGAQVELVAQVAREFRLRNAVRQLLAEGIAGSDGQPAQVPDYVIIDCPPGLDLLTVNALAASDEVLVPMQCEYYSMEGLSQLHATIGQVREYLNPDLIEGPILLTMFDETGELSAEVADEVRDFFPERVLRTVIPRCPDLAEAPSHGQTIATYRPVSRGALAYRVAAYEVAHGGLPEQVIDLAAAEVSDPSLRTTGSAVAEASA